MQILKTRKKNVYNVILPNVDMIGSAEISGDLSRIGFVWTLKSKDVYAVNFKNVVQILKTQFGNITRFK